VLFFAYEHVFCNKVVGVLSWKARVGHLVTIE